jgi:hypothetical protein
MHGSAQVMGPLTDRDRLDLVNGLKLRPFEGVVV